MLEKKSIEIKVKSFRKIPNPYYLSDETDNNIAEMYFIICDVKEVPDDIPIGTNPREPKLTTGVAKKIKNTLINPSNNNFYLLNRGLLLSAEKVSYNTKRDTVLIEFNDLDVHGNIDGGHTYQIIKDYKSNLDYNQQYVKIEILTGVEDIFQQLASARNTSTQVQDKSIAELEDRFQIIKKAIEKEQFFKEVYFKENQKGDIDVADILSILNLFNLEKYPGMSDYPIVSYSGKKQCIDTYINNHKKYGDKIANPYVKMENVMVDFFRLYDMLEVSARDYYSKGISNKKYGAITGVVTKKEGNAPFQSKFYQNNINYTTPNGFIFPILGAFRALLKEAGDGMYIWKEDPLEVMKKLGADLVNSTVDMSRELGNNPNSTGKNKTLWKNLYMCVLMETMKE